ncbi:hypothetical protein [Coxiella-like endosymbiont]|uniref:phenylalanine--tRNA ligase subunit beta-related protein n=2 Tax=Coxiellaceae TaxID=118968 RepID=UPI0028696DD9|nr:hypothetical protein [Coxiella-like endosymbiont]
MVHRDLALVVDQDVEASQIEEEIIQNAGHLLIMIEIFDIYESGEDIELGEKSIALGLTFQDSSRTLRDEEIKQVIEGIISTLKCKFNVKLRA